MATVRKIFQTSLSSSPSIFVAPAGVKSYTVRLQKSTPTIFPGCSYSGSPLTYNMAMLRPDGSFLEWGLNAPVSSSASPTLILGSVNLTQIFQPPLGEMNSNNFFGADKNGLIYAWGSANSSGELGLGTVTATSTPTVITLGSKIKRIWNFNGSMECAFAQDFSGNIYAWGWSRLIPLPAAAGTAYSTPTVIIGGYKFNQIFLSNTYCGWGILPNGTAYAWSPNTSGQAYGQEGINSTSGYFSTPTLVVGGGTYKTIFPMTYPQPFGSYPSPFMGSWTVNGAFINGSAFYLDTSNNLYGCGYNGNGVLGTNTILNYSSPVLVVGGHSYQGVYASLGSYSAFLLGTDGTLYGTGTNTAGQLGQNNNTHYSSPVVIASGTKFSTTIITTVDNTIFAYDTSGNLWGWGPNTYGQLLKAGATSSPSIIVNAGTYQQISISAYGVIFALDYSGNIYAWGSNTCSGNYTSGVLGTGLPAAMLSSPTLIAAPTNNWAEIVTNPWGCSNWAVDNSGMLWGWGDNTINQLGTGSGYKSSPTIVVGNLINQAQSLTENTQSISLTPGVSYPIVLGPLGCFIGGQQIGQGVYYNYGQMIIEWEI